MDDRRDALCAAAELVLAVEVAARDEAAFDSVATSARLTCLPGAINVVPGRAEVLVDVRGVDVASMERVVERIRASAQAISARRGVRLGLTTLSDGRPTVLSEPVVRMLAETVRQLGEEPLLLPSGAGHDAQCLAATADVGMLFVPSVGGLSHCPQELTRPDDVVAGVQALAAGWLRLAAFSADRRAS
jgi:N-carbamoyl-L-amino-acid hydrolase